MEEQSDISRVAQTVLRQLEAYLRDNGPMDPQKYKHITGTLKDIRDLQQEQQGPSQLVVVFDRDAEAAAQ